jgi:hypothetical protein
MAAMESKLTRQLEDDLISAVQRLTPEERLRAFLAHCRLVSELREAGRRHRAGSPRQTKS